MNYISLEKKILTGRNNNQVLPFIVDFDSITPVQFQIVNKNNQLQPIPQGTYYFAGGLKTKTIDSILFLSQDFTITDDIITFNVDTYTSTFLEHITKRNMQIDIEIGVFTADGSKYVILRDYALACPRIYIDSLPPEDIDLDRYYTKNQIDAILSERIPTKTSQLENDSGFLSEANIPTKTSQLENDSGFLTTIPAEYITQTQLTEKGYLTEIPAEYITETQLEGKNYVTETELNQKGYITTIPDEYVTETELTEKGYLTEIPAEYITETQLEGKGYLTEIPSEYITETQLEDKNYVTETELSEKGYITTIPDEYVTETELTEKGYLTEIPAEYITETQLEGKNYVDETQLAAKGYLTEIPPEYITETELDQKGYLTEIPPEYTTEHELHDLDQKLSQELSLKENVIQYTETTNTTITLSKGIYYRNLDAITSLILTIDQNSNDSVLLFSTGDTFTVTLNIESAFNFKVNQDFEFVANKTYLIAVDNYTILWSEVQNYTA